MIQHDEEFFRYYEDLEDLGHPHGAELIPAPSLKKGHTLSPRCSPGTGCGIITSVLDDKVTFLTDFGNVITYYLSEVLANYEVTGFEDNIISRIEYQIRSLKLALETLTLADDDEERDITNE